MNEEILLDDGVEDANVNVDDNVQTNDIPPSDEKIEIPTMKVQPLKKICMTIGELPSSYLETMTYYEMLVWFIEFLRNTVIPTVNNNSEAVQEVQTIVMTLQNYINNYKETIDDEMADFQEAVNDDIKDLEDYMNDYFNNLDVQDEINNKLDDMLEQGTLQEIIYQFLQSNVAWTFDTVADMKLAENFIDGSFAQTLGYHNINDGGLALYKIRTKTNDDVIDEATLIAVYDNTLVAELIIKDNTINVLTFGVVGDGETDNTTNLQKAASYASANNYDLMIPEGTYLTDSITLENIKYVNIKGHIVLSGSDQNLNVFENVNGETPKIFINKVTVGNIVMKGLNSADVTIQNANKLILLADNTTGHNFIGYTTFNLGYVRYLELKDDGSGTKWINENLFIGGRYLGVTIGGDSSTYNHQNNLFLKPMCENTVINIVKGIGNRFIDARLEGESTTITFGATTFGNVITCNYASIVNTYHLPHYFNSVLQSKVTDNSGGKNKVINNEDLAEHLVLSINKFNNPKELTVSGDNVLANSGNLMFESDYVSLPTCDCLLYLNSTNKNITWRIECYDETFTKLTTNPNLFISPTTIAYTSAGTYGNSAYTRNDYWGLMDSTNADVKYIKVKLYCPSGQGLTNEPYKNIDMYLTHYGKLNNEGYYIKGLGTQAPSV